MPAVIQSIWQINDLPDGPVRIYPDGCQDVILVRPRIGQPYWKVATLDRRVRVLAGAGGAALWGARLAPGAHIPARLFHEFRHDSPDGAEKAIAEICRVPDHFVECLEAARSAPGASVADLARSLGVSVRSLQRQVKTDSSQGPLFWLRLMRLRHALSEACTGVPLAEVAAGAGFADQAHFTREAVAFHGATPARLLRDKAALEGILAPGL